MARKKQTKKYTLSEFKAWLDGIEEIQPADWHPDANQWKMIRDKINAIVVPPPPKPAPAIQPGQHMAGPGPVITRQPSPPQSAFDPPVGNGTPGTSMLDTSAAPTPAMTPAAQAALQGKLPKGDALPAEMSVNATQATKTPNIDTMTKEYESGFS